MTGLPPMVFLLLQGFSVARVYVKYYRILRRCYDVHSIDRYPFVIGSNDSSLE